ncbi:hypothetical protein [Halorhabdus salina]|uniref:hypothetical protein n=1 Tax=Halorhabdus salina TaxID=2750670 RepID=UPI0015EE6703|nr:hypothetical protein [Halorhabdus salina]
MVDENGRLLAVALVAIGLALTFGYSLFVNGTILLWTWFVVPIIFLYLCWRFVRAHERIADALEGEA